MADLTGLTREQLIERRDLLLRRKELLQQQSQQPESPGQPAPTQKATPDQFLTPAERLSTGFRTNPEKFLEQRRSELGLAPGTPLEPTGFNLENIADLPQDVLDAIGPAFPAIGQITAGALASPSGPGIIAAGAAGAGGGEVARQLIGEALGFDQGTVGERLSRVGFETALGVGSEAAVLGLNTALRATKKGILDSFVKLSRKKGFEKFVTQAGRIFRNTKPEIAEEGIRLLRKGDKSILSPKFSQKEFLDTFTERFIFGADGNIAKNIQTLASRPGAKEPVKQMFKLVTGLSDDTLDVAIRKGSKVADFADPKNILKLGKRVVSELAGLFKTTGDNLATARKNLIKSAGGLDVTDALTGANTELAQGLKTAGFLLDEGGGIFRINPEFALTSTGRTQASTFTQMVTKFFSTPQGLSEAQESALRRAIIDGDEGLIRKITRDKVFSVKNSTTFKKFAEQLKTLDVQISGKEFKSLSKLSPELAQYLKNLRGITLNVADQVGDNSVRTLTKAYEELAETALPLRQGTKLKSIDQVESMLKRLSNPKLSNEATRESAEALNGLIKRTTGVDFVDSLRSFGAAQELKTINELGKRTTVKSKLAGIMRTSFSERVGRLRLDEIARAVDPVLPNNLKIALNANRHAVASAIHQDALGLLRARFLSSSLIVPTIGAATGGVVGGQEGATIGLVGGFALQNPRLFRALMRKAAERRAIPQALRTAAPQLPRTAGVGGIQVLQQLLSQAE